MGITLHNRDILRQVSAVSVIATTGAAGRAELMVAADIPLLEITITACAIRSLETVAVASAMTFQTGIGRGIPLLCVWP